MKTLLLLIAISMGVIFPQGEKLSFLVQYGLMGLLVFAFLNLKIEKEIIKKEHFYLLAANLIIPFIFYFSLIGTDSNLALAAFITALSPTAVAAPAVIYQLKGKVEFVAFSVLLTNFSIAFLVPFLLPLILKAEVAISVPSVLFPIVLVLTVPFAAVQIMKKYIPAAFRWLEKNRDISFYLLVFNIYLASAKATHFVADEYAGPRRTIYLIALLSAVICIVSFFVGSRIGRKSYRLETMQSLGQKNNVLSIWIALTFINPLTALGPVFYILFHNIAISLQLYNIRKRL